MLKHPSIWFAVVGMIAVGVTSVIDDDPSTAARPAEEAFEITGQVDGLYPGADTMLDVEVTNPQPFAIRIVTISVTVHDASSACPASLLRIPRARTDVQVPRNDMRAVPITVHMARATPNRCQNVTFPLDLTARALAHQQPPNGDPTNPGDGPLPITGSDLVPLLAIAAGLTTLGALVIGTDRRRLRFANRDVTMRSTTSGDVDVAVQNQRCDRGGDHRVNGG